MKKYQMVYNDIIENLKNGNLKSGDKLPSEMELCKKYDVSRYTIRRALDILHERGYLQKNQGSSSIITYKHPFAMPVSDVTSFQELNKLLSIKPYQSVAIYND